MNNVEVSVGLKPINLNGLKRKNWLVAALLAAILLLGGALRLNGLEWDQRSGYHPDERFITMVTSGMKWPTSIAQFLNPRESPLNPYWNVVEKREQAFAYGTLPVYLTKATSEIMGRLVDKKWAEYGWNMIVGRAISGILDTFAILLLFLIGRKVINNKTGLLAAGLYAVTTLSIQHSHFYTTDITLNFFVLLAIYFALDIVKTGGIRSGFATGAAIGMALASKISAAPLVLIVPVAVALYLRRINGWGNWQTILQKALPPIVASAIGAILLHFIFAPYTFLDLQGLLRNLKEQNDILISGIADRPFVRQYFQTTPFLYPIEQMIRWSLGWPLGITSLIGLGLMAFYAVRGKRLSSLAWLTLAWIVPYFLITGGSQAKFLRYMLPILPLLALCAATLLMRLVDAARARPIALRAGAYALLAMVVVGTTWWALAFMHIYAAPHTANQASAWINANVPKTAVIAMEHWEEGIAGLTGYQTPPGQVQIQSYEEDTPAKVRMYSAALTKADYIVNFSSRLYGTVPRIADRYPMSREYYKKLFAGELGYELVYYGESFPQAFGVGVFEDTFTRPGLPRPAPLQTLNFAPLVINNGFADESFSAYDHPLVLVWKKTREISAQEIESALIPLVPAQPWNPQLAKSNNQQPVLNASQRAANEAGGTFTDLFDPDGLINQMPLLFWMLALGLFTLIGLPLALTIGKNLPDRAYIFSPVLGLLLVGWLVWMLASLGILLYTRTTIFGGALVALVLAGWLFWRDRTEMIAWLRVNLKLILLNKGLWIAAFLLFMVVRMNNPDLWHPGRGGEKPMDFAYLMANVKSTTMPPYDPWFAGGYINYYYYGQYLISVIIKLTGVLPEVAYNLAIPTLFAMTFAGAWSIAYNLGMLFIKRAKPAITGGLVAGLMMAVFGNMDSGARIFRLLVSIGGAGTIPEQAVYTLPIGDVLTRFIVGLGKLLSNGEKALSLGADWYWQSSRIYPGSGSIQEFPNFTFLYADLHAHMLAMPFALLVAAIALTLMLRVRERGAAKFGSLRESLGDAFAIPHVLRVVLAGMALGALWTINSWDYPGYALLIGLTMLLGWWHSRADGKANSKHLAFTLISGLSVAALSYLMYLPFHRAFVQGYTGFHAQDERSPFVGFLAVFFAFLFAVISWAVYSLASKQPIRTKTVKFQNAQPRFSPQHTHKTSRGPFRAFWLLNHKTDKVKHTLSLMAALEGKKFAAGDEAAYDVAASTPASSSSSQAAPLSQNARWVWRIVGVVLFALFARVVIGAFGPVAAFGAVMFLFMVGVAITRKTIAESFAAAAAAMAFLGIGFVEVLALEGDIGRMNTVFKFYLQAWTLLALASGFGAAVILSARRSVPRIVWSVIFAVLLIGAATYPVFASSAKIRDRWDSKQAPTLNGMQYMNTVTYVDEINFNSKVTQAQLKLSDDLAAINWIRANIKGSPVMLEALSGPQPHPRLYSWGGRISIYTGLPTIIGWDWHQRQQRLGIIDIENRVNDVMTIYTSPDLMVTQIAIKKYGVSYIYFGPLEKFHYPAGEAKLADLATRGLLEKVYDAQNVAIYKVMAEN